MHSSVAKLYLKDAVYQPLNVQEKLKNCINIFQTDF